MSEIKQGQEYQHLEVDILMEGGHTQAMSVTPREARDMAARLIAAADELEGAESVDHADIRARLVKRINNLPDTSSACSQCHAALGEPEDREDGTWISVDRLYVEQGRYYCASCLRDYYIFNQLELNAPVVVWEFNDGKAMLYHDQRDVDIATLLAELDALRGSPNAYAEALVRAERAEALNRRANAMLGSCWSLLQHVLGGHFPRPEIEQMVNELEKWNNFRGLSLDG